MEKAGHPIHRFAHFAMGTSFEILLTGKDKTYAGQVSQAAFYEIDRIEDLFSRFNPCSEIGQINSLKPGQSLKVGVDVFECLETASEIQKQTQGAFDINICSLIKCKHDSISESSKMNPAKMRLPLELYQTSEGYTVRAHEKGDEYSSNCVDLDLGGIGKGYALDKISDILSDWSVDQALIHGGTSTVLAIGSAPVKNTDKGGWPVGIAGDWKCSRAPKRFFLKDRALSGSGIEVKGKHIFDPRTGGPAKGHLAVWVSHPSAAVSDALSTAFMVMSTDEVKTYCDNNSEVWALVIIDSETCQIFNDGVAVA